MLETIDIEDPAQLIRYLDERGYLKGQAQPGIRILHGGVSNRTVLVEFVGASWVLKQALSQLRVAVGWFADPARIHREALGLRWLQQLAPPGSVPQLVFEDFDQHILGMEAVPQPHENWKSLLLQGQLDQNLIAQFGELLGTVHRNAFHRRAEILSLFEDRSFFEELRLEPYYAYAASQVSEAAPFLDRLIEETRATSLTLVHGDYSPKNILVHAGKLVLLDHEVIHFGDPSFDLGFSLTHLLSKAHHLPELRLAFSQAAILYWDTYRETLGLQAWVEQLERRTVRQTIGCLLARIAGRSPLEYLTAEERDRQRSASIKLMASPPANIPDMVECFLGELTE